MLLLRFPPARKCLVGTFESFLCGFGEFCSNLYRSDSEGVTPSRPASLLSPSRLLVGEALVQKFSTIYTTPSCCRSNPSLHHTCWTEEGGDVEVPHVCISRRLRHLWC